MVTVSCAAAAQRFRNDSSFCWAGIPTLGTRVQKSGKASLKIRLPMPKIGWHVNVSFRYSGDFQQRSVLSAMTAPATARLGRLLTHGDG